MISRNIGSIIRGRATPFQILAASILGSLIAFVPGFAQAPGLLALLVILLVIVNANLFVAGAVGIAAKLLALILTPVSFAAGRLLLDGPLGGLFSFLINAPVTAFFGFEYYLVTGGQLLGLLVGLGTGLFLVKSVRSTWRKLASLERGSAAYQKWASRRWVRILAFVFVGGTKGKKEYDQLLARKVGNPVRPLGALLVALVLVLGFVAIQFLDRAIVTALIRSGLERANGATVDLADAELAPQEGRLVLRGLAMADPDNLETNLFAAEAVEAKLSTTDILRKRATIDTAVVTGGSQGGTRKVKGQRIGPQPKPSKGDGIELPDFKSLEDLLKNAEVWKERLATLKRWIERFSGSRDEPAETPESWEERMRERIRLLGYAGVRNDALIERAPTLLIRRLEAQGVKSSVLPDETLDIAAENLSTQPHLVGERPRIQIASSSGKLRSTLDLPNTAGVRPRLNFALTGLSVDAVVTQLAGDRTPPVQGGTLDISAEGEIGLVDSNLPVALTLHDTSLKLGDGKGTPVAKLTVPVALRGPIDNPRVRVDQSAFKNVLVSAGKEELTRRLGSELDKRLGGSKAGESGGEDEGKQDGVKDAARGLLKGFLEKKKPAEQPNQPPSP